MFETVLSERCEVIHCFNVSRINTKARSVFVNESTLVLRLAVRLCRCFR